MEYKEILNINIKIKEILSKILHIDLNLIKDDILRSDIVNWNSLAQMAIIVEIENVFGIEFSAEEIVNLNSYSLICSTVIKKHLNE